MYNFRYISRLITLFFTRFKALIFISALFGIILFLVVTYIFPIIFTGGVHKIGVTGRYSVANLPTEILELISSGLTKENSDGSLSEGIAKSWEVLDNGKTWKFILRDDLVWQDKKKLVSTDINYEFSDVNVERPDSQTIIFKLQEPYSPFGNVVARPIFKKGLLGMGEWKVKRISTNSGLVESITLENNDSQKLIYKFYPTEDRTKTAFMLGEINEIKDSYDLSPFNSWKGPKIEENIDLSQQVVLFFNTQDKYLSEKNLRQALNYAIDKDSLSDERSYGPTSLSSWAYNSQVKKYEFDKTKAVEAVKALPDELKTGMSINISVLNSTLLPLAEKISASWKDAGIESTVSVNTVVPENYQALLAIVNIPNDPDQYSLWHSTQMGSNISKLSNPRIDKLLEDGRTITNIEERKKVYLDFQRFLVEESPAVFFYYPKTYTIIR